jgi:hypothetical protein
MQIIREKDFEINPDSEMLIVPRQKTFRKKCCEIA